MSTREVPILNLIGNLAMDPKAFANDMVDAADAKLKLNPTLEVLSDTMKPILKQALADVLSEQLHAKLAGVTITCED